MSTEATGANLQKQAIEVNWCNKACTSFRLSGFLQAVSPVLQVSLHLPPAMCFSGHRTCKLHFCLK